MNKRLHFFETEPIIAAVKTEEQLMRALTSECNIIFFLFGNICNIPKLVESVKERGKHAFVHLDLINGLASKEIAAYYIRSFTRADGVLSYFDLKRGESKEIPVKLTATYKGRYYLPSIYCEAMYDNSVRALKKGEWIEVVE